MNYITTYLRKIISRGYYSTIHLCGWIVLFCAVIRAINYTDIHEVDEDIMTIVNCGGCQIDNFRAGIIQRYLCNYPFGMVDVVASSDIRN